MGGIIWGGGARLKIRRYRKGGFECAWRKEAFRGSTHCFVSEEEGGRWSDRLRIEPMMDDTKGPNFSL